MLYENYLIEKKFDEALIVIVDVIKTLYNENEINNFINNVEETVDNLYNEEKLTYKEYDDFLEKLWKITGGISYSTDGLKLQDTLNIRIEKGKIEVGDIVTFKLVKDSFAIPTPYKVTKIDNETCSLTNLLNNKKYKTKLSYLDKRDKLYLNQNFGKKE